MPALRKILPSPHRISSYLKLVLVLGLWTGVVRVQANELRKPAFLMRMDQTGELLYIDTSAEASFDLHIYMGPQGNLKPVPMNRAQRNADGSTLITLATGEKIFLTAASQHAQRPYWMDRRGSKTYFYNLGVKPERLTEYGLGTFYAVASADNALKIDEAFQDSDGNRILRMRPLTGQTGPRFYWSPADQRFIFPLQTLPASGEAKIRFLAPTARDPFRHAQISIHGRRLTVSCDQGAQCFNQLGPISESRLQHQLGNGQLEVMRLPDVRAVDMVLKFDETYIVVDRPRLSTGAAYDVFIGEKGNLQKVEVARFLRYKDNDSVHIDLADGRTIYSPSTWNQQLHPLLYFPTRPHQPVPLQRIKLTEDELQELGIPLERYALNRIKTPVSATDGCAVFLTNPPINP